MSPTHINTRQRCVGIAQLQSANKFANMQLHVKKGGKMIRTECKNFNKTINTCLQTMNKIRKIRVLNKFEEDDKKLRDAYFIIADIYEKHIKKYYEEKLNT